MSTGGLCTVSVKNPPDFTRRPAKRGGFGISDQETTQWKKKVEETLFPPHFSQRAQNYA